MGLGYYGRASCMLMNCWSISKHRSGIASSALKDLLMAGISVSSISKATNGIDRWFLYEIQKICNLEKEIEEI